MLRIGEKWEMEMPYKKKYDRKDRKIIEEGNYE